jgi:hypothetical protein
MNAKRTLATLAAAGLIASFVAAHASASDSTAASAEASQVAIGGSGMIVDGSAQLIRAGGALTIAGITALGDASVIVLRDVATGSQASVRVGVDVAQAGSLAVGETVSVVAEATGMSLFAGGRLVAFVPNAIGRALVYAARSTQR